MHRYAAFALLAHPLLFLLAIRDKSSDAMNPSNLLWVGDLFEFTWFADKTVNPLVFHTSDYIERRRSRGGLYINKASPCWII